MRNWRAPALVYPEGQAPYCDVCGKTLLGVPWAKLHTCERCKAAVTDAAEQRRMNPGRQDAPERSGDG